jgi:hypothetical protein
MTPTKFKNLTKKDKVSHKDYGICEVVGYIDGFGPQLRPLTRRGVNFMDMFQTPGTPCLEGSPRKLSSITDEEAEKYMDL